MVSKWAGMVRQSNGSDYPVALTFKDEGIDVDYPTLGCGGVLQPIKFDAGLFQTIEHIERGMGQCDEGIHVVLHKTAERCIDAEFFKFGILVARGTIVRSPEFPPEGRL